MYRCTQWSGPAVYISYKSYKSSLCIEQMWTKVRSSVTFLHSKAIVWQKHLTKSPYVFGRLIIISILPFVVGSNKTLCKTFFCKSAAIASLSFQKSPKGRIFHLLCGWKATRAAFLSEAIQRCSWARLLRGQKYYSTWSVSMGISCLIVGPEWGLTRDLPCS